MSEPSEREVAIFSAARNLAADERAAYLSQACGGDAGLCQRIEELLSVNETSGDFLDNPADSDLVLRPPVPGASIPISEKPGDTIGQYKLLQQIGEGGGGIVYMADQQSPLRRRVALKIIKLGMDTRQVIARFEAERQALALMDHPNIAKVFDAGATETGRPFVVMELVRGIKITDFCDRDALTTFQRLELFITVCQAIQHAHQKGIIHRDIKPSNILVTVLDGVAVPKIIDFGIAKAVQGKLTDQTLFTAFGQFMGTPAYMSPEQADLSGEDIDTRSDIYSLGALLYELLTGQTPFDSKALLRAGWEQMRRTIREQEPARPSTKLSTMMADDLTAAAHRRGSEPPKLVHLVKGDLDWIVMKCLEKDRSRRYPTASGLALDVQHHLANEPITARPPGNFYRFQKFVGRNKLFVAAVALVAFALALGGSISLWQAVRATRAERQQAELRRLAQNETEKSKQVAAFFEEMLAGAGPLKALGRDTSVLAEILDTANAKLASDLTNEPDVQAEVRTKIGEIYLQMGRYVEAETAARDALRLRQSIFPPTNELVAEAIHHLGTILWREGKLAEAETTERLAFEGFKAAYGPDSLSAAEAEYILASVLDGKGEANSAESLLRGALDSIKNATRAPPDQQGRVDDDLFSIYGDLGILETERLEYPQAEENLARALALAQKLFPSNDMRVASAYNNLATTQRQQPAKLSFAQTNQRQAFLICQSVLPPSHPYVGFSRNNLAIILRRLGSSTHDPVILSEALETDPTDAMNQEAFAAISARPAITLLSNPTNLWHFTSKTPPADWASPDFPDSDWPTTNALAGSPTSLDRLERFPQPLVSLTNLWLRHQFDLPQLPAGVLAFWISPNHDAQIFLNGVQAAPIAEWRDTPTYKPLSEAGRHALRPGRNTIAIHCQDADGAAPIDVALCVSTDPTLGWKKTLATLDAMTVANVDRRVAFLIASCHAHARLAQWQAALGAFSNAIPQLPNDATAWYQGAPLLAQSGDPTFYDTFRRQGLARFQTSPDPNAAARVARLALFTPAPPDELEIAGKLADLAASDATDPGIAVRQFAKGLADLRRGNFVSAVDWLRKTIVSSMDSSQPFWTHERQSNRCAAALFLEALALHKTGRSAEASAAFQQALDLTQTQLASESSGDIGKEWPEWLGAHIFMREAQAELGIPAEK